MARIEFEKERIKIRSQFVDHEKDVFAIFDPIDPNISDIDDGTFEAPEL